MQTWIIVVIVVIAILLLLAAFVAGNYNALVKLRNLVKDGWAQVDVVLKRRADLIPGLVETVKGYAKHEKETLDAVISARSRVTGANSPKEEMKANNELSSALSRLLVVAESYPELKANTNFVELQKELSNSETKIEFARKFYNETVLKFNNKVEMFPSNIFAGMFGFKVAEFFEIDEADREAPEVKF